MSGSIRVFHRVWWKANASWPGGREPFGGGTKHFIAWAQDESQARRICKEWASNHDEGPMSDRAEFEDRY